jgi:hypothetical protein
MKKLIIVFVFIGLTTIGFTQNKQNTFEVSLEELDVLDVNYNYLNAIGYWDAAIPVRKLAQKVASFDLEFSNCLEADYEKLEYYVQYKIPEGEIIVTYDNEGEIIRTSERFIDISLPLAVSNAIVKKYPGWKISSDIYSVTYVKNLELNKIYKLFIEKINTGKRVILVDENGNFI